jgi:DNA-binding winged helix-turn-helix (wHTH) protein
MRFQFDGWIFDSGTRELLRDGLPLHISPKAFELLGALLAARPRALSKAEIHDCLWPATHVSEATLTSLVAELRSALGESARSPQWLRTVHGFGYAFSGTALDATAASKRRPRRVDCRLILPDREVNLEEGENLLGRSRDAAAWIDSARVSRRHARIVVAEGRATIEDLGSKNGTLVRGQKISGSVPLADGDEIHVGVTMVFRIFGAATTETGSGR